MRQSRVRKMSPNPKNYISFADNIRRSKPAFAKIKQIYGEELERLNSEKIKKNLSFKKLTEKEKMEIRERVRSQIKNERRKELIIGITVFLIACVIYILIRI